MNGIRTYAEYNYLRPGLATHIKRRHFEAAQQITRNHIGKCSAIDFGCADGVLLPSLARRFHHVVEIDSDPGFVEISKNVVNRLQLANVTVLCNRDRSISEVKALLPPHDFRLLFLLEVLEHVGEQARLYASKMEFLEEIARLIDPQGLVIVSVPNMIGTAFLLQRFALGLLKLKREPMTLAELLRAGLLRRTDGLERRWCGEHLGFNHRKLEKHPGRSFIMARKKHLFFRVVYLLRPKP